MTDQDDTDPKPVFLRARHKFSSSIGQWEYFEIYPEAYAADLNEALQEWANEEFRSKYDYSEHYRGCDYEVIPKPPQDWLKEQIIRMLNTCEKYWRTIARYQDMLQEPDDEGKS